LYLSPVSEQFTLARPYRSFPGNIWWAYIKIVVLHLLALLSIKDEMVGLIPLKMALKFKNALLPPEGRKLLYNLLSSTGYWTEILKN
jgi:hypothetical protein